MSKCIGCGITLQNINTSGLGYTKNLDNKYCERCFRTIHYNEEKKIKDFNSEEIINKINNLGLFTIFITDLMSINKELINYFKRISNKKVLVINKCDIIPDNLKLEHIEENIKNSYEISDEVFFISAKKNMYLNKVIDLFEEHQKVIFCGETSSGKSTLINNIVGSNLTTSKYNNTTLDFIKIKYNNYVIYDSPGIIINDNKPNYDKIMISIKKLSSDFVLTVDDLKIKGNGNITCYITENSVINSKKEDTKLAFKTNIVKNCDIELENGGFIFIKGMATIFSNKKLNIRKSIIGK